VDLKGEIFLVFFHLTSPRKTSEVNGTFGCSHWVKSSRWATDLDERQQDKVRPYTHRERETYRAWDLRKKNRKKYWNRSDNKPWRCVQHVKNYDFKDAFVLNLIANNCIKLLLLTSQQISAKWHWLKMLLATARFVITTIQRKCLYFFVFFFPNIPRSILTPLVCAGRLLTGRKAAWRTAAAPRSGTQHSLSHPVISSLQHYHI